MDYKIYKLKYINLKNFKQFGGHNTLSTEYMDKNLNKLMELLWQKIKIFGMLVRKNRLDGLDSWTIIKDNIPNTIKLIWSSNSLNFYQHLRDLGVKGGDGEGEIDDDKTSPAWEPHHFLLQHGRIIKNNRNGDLRRLCQIAYNSGQLDGQIELESSFYTQEMLEFIKENKLYELSTFISENIKIDYHEFIELINNIDVKIIEYLDK